MNSRGFVLSLATLLLALFILTFARMEADHLFTMRYSHSQIWNDLLPARWGEDARLDINVLVNQRFRMDQNTTTVLLYYAGTLPSPLSNRANWLRYQTALHQMGRDSNGFLFVDLNQTLLDGNILGRTDTGFQWKENLDSNRMVFVSTNTFSQMRGVDINITAESAYTSRNAWSLQGSGNVRVNWRYTDTNSTHTDSNSGWVSFGSISRYDWIYGNGAYRFSLIFSPTPDGNGFILDNNAPSSLTVRYSARFLIDANTVPTRAGYNVPITSYRGDTNYTSATQWVYP